MIEIDTIKNLPKVVFTNKDYSFANFMKAFYEKGQFSSGPFSLRCKKAATTTTAGNRFKGV